MRQKDLLEEFIDDIAFFRDIDNDFEDRRYHSELKTLEQQAMECLGKILVFSKGYNRVNVAIIGNFSSGKSTFVNSLLGKDVCPMKACPTTSSITKFVYGDEPGIYLDKGDGELVKIKRDEYYAKVQHKIENMRETPVFQFEYRYPFDHFRNIALYDTPGFGNPKNSVDEEITEQLVREQADVIFFIQNINIGALEDSTHSKIEELMRMNQRAEWYLILNFLDTKSPLDAKKMFNSFGMKFRGKFKEVFLYSSKDVLDKSIGNNALEQMKEKVEMAVKREIKANREKFEIKIKGKPKEGSHKQTIIKIDDETIELTSSENGSQVVKQALLELLEITSQQKHQYMEFHKEKILSNYRKNRLSFIEDMERDISRKVTTLAEKNGKGNEFQNDFRSFRKNFIELLEVTRKKRKNEISRFLEKIIHSKEIPDSGIFIDDAKFHLQRGWEKQLLELIKYLVTPFGEYFIEWDGYFKKKGHVFELNTLRDVLTNYFSESLTKKLTKRINPITKDTYSSLSEAEGDCPIVIEDLSDKMYEEFNNYILDFLNRRVAEKMLTAEIGEVHSVKQHYLAGVLEKIHNFNNKNSGGNLT